MWRRIADVVEWKRYIYIYTGGVVWLMSGNDIFRDNPIHSVCLFSIAIGVQIIEMYGV